MKRTPKNLAKHELIGLEVEVKESTDPSKIGVKGKVVDETKNTLKVLSNGAEKAIPKKECTFLFKLEDATVEVEGKILVAKPEERIKRVSKND